MQRCHRAIVHASHTTPAVSWQRLVLHEEYHEATPEYKVQISRLDRVLTRLEAITAVGPSLTCTRTVHPDGTTELSLRRMFGDKDYFAAKSTDGPLLSVNPDLPTALHGMYHRPQLLNFSGKHGVIARLFVVLAFVGALVGGIMTFVDLVSDCLVVRELWLDDQRWWSVGSAIIILVSLLVSVFVLARERRYVHGSVVLTPGICSSRRASVCLAVMACPVQLRGSVLPDVFAGRLAQRNQPRAPPCGACEAGSHQPVATAGRPRREAASIAGGSLRIGTPDGAPAVHCIDARLQHHPCLVVGVLAGKPGTVLGSR